MYNSYVNFFAKYLDSHITIGKVILDEFEEAVNPLINSSLELAVGKYRTLCNRLCTKL